MRAPHVLLQKLFFGWWILHLGYILTLFWRFPEHFPEKFPRTRGAHAARGGRTREFVTPTPPPRRPKLWVPAGPIWGKMTRAEGAEDFFWHCPRGHSDPKWTPKHHKNPYLPYFGTFLAYLRFLGGFEAILGVFGPFCEYFENFSENHRFWSI